MVSGITKLPDDWLCCHVNMYDGMLKDLQCHSPSAYYIVVTRILRTYSLIIILSIII